MALRDPADRPLEGPREQVVAGLGRLRCNVVAPDLPRLEDPLDERSLAAPRRTLHGAELVGGRQTGELPGPGVEHERLGTFGVHVAVPGIEQAARAAGERRRIVSKRDAAKTCGRTARAKSETRSC